MTPETLLKYATAAGIDLMHHAAMEPPKRARPVVSQFRRPAASTRQAKREQTVRREQFGDDSAIGTATRVRRRASWSAAELAQACAGMRRLEWATLCLTVGQSETDRITVKAALLDRAAALATRENWPEKIRRRNCQACGRASKPHYLEDLVTLVLLEWLHPTLYSSPYKQATWFGVSYEHWHRQVGPCYETLRGYLESWYGGALGHIWRSLRCFADEDENGQGSAVSKSA